MDTGNLELIAPNPIRPGQRVAIRRAKALQGLRLADATGRVVARQNLSGPEADWTWPEVPAGFYSLQLWQDGGPVKAFRFVAQ